MTRAIDWEVVSGVSGVVSAVAAVISLGGLARARKTNRSIGVVAPWAPYLLFCSGWVLLVMAFTWFFQPFGPYLTRWDEKKLYGAMLGVPAPMVTVFAYRRLQPVSSESKHDANNTQAR